MGHMKIGEFVNWTITLGKYRIPLHGEIVFYSWIVMALIIGLAFWATRGMSIEHPTRRQNVLEAIIVFLRGAMATAGSHAFDAFPVAATLFLFILVSNLIGLLPLPGIDISLKEHSYHLIKSPTEDASVTVAMGLIAFFSIIYYGLKANGFNYLKSFFKPFFVFFPINLIDFLVKPVTLSFRLFGNIFAGAIFMLVLYNLVPPLVPVLALSLNTFVGCIQAYLFFMLTSAYVSAAIEEGQAHQETEGHEHASPAH